MDKASNTPLVKLPMKLAFQDFLQNQLRNPLEPETLLDGERRCEVLRKLTWRNKEYLPADPLKRKLADEISVPASVAKALCKESVAAVIPDNRRERGRWDVFELGPEKLLGFSPWDSGADPTYNVGIPKLAQTEYDHCWIPCRERAGGRGDYSAVFYLPYWLVQRCAIKGSDKNWERSQLVIDLPFEGALMRRPQTVF